MKVKRIAQFISPFQAWFSRKAPMDQEGVSVVLMRAKPSVAALSFLRRFQPVLSSTRAVLWELDLNTLRMTIMPGLQEILGCSKNDEELFAEDVVNLLHPHEQELVRRQLKKFLAHPPASADFEHRLRSGDGNYRWAITRLSLVGSEQTDSRRIAGLTLDITKQKQEEVRLTLANQKLLDSNFDLERFASTAAHELQQPLGYMQHHLDQLLEHSEGLQDDASMKSLKVTRQTAFRLNRLVSSLLTHSQVGRKWSSFERCPSEELVNSALMNLEPQIQQLQPHITVGELPKIWCDRALIVQAFENLLSNSLAYRSSRPIEIEVSTQSNEECVVFRVRDNGQGIDPDDLEKFLNPFERGRHPQESASMGLAITKRIIDWHGGELWVESQVGGGASFYFSIPRAPSLV